MKTGEVWCQCCWLRLTKLWKAWGNKPDGWSWCCYSIWSIWLRRFKTGDAGATWYILWTLWLGPAFELCDAHKMPVWSIFYRLKVTALASRQLLPPDICRMALKRSLTGSLERPLVRMWKKPLSSRYLTQRTVGLLVNSNALYVSLLRNFFPCLCRRHALPQNTAENHLLDTGGVCQLHKKAAFGQDSCVKCEQFYLLHNE